MLYRFWPPALDDERSRWGEREQGDLRGYAERNPGRIVRLFGPVSH